MSRYASQSVHAVGKAEPTKSKKLAFDDAGDDDWETDPDYVNAVSERDQRYGSAEIGIAKGLEVGTIDEIRARAAQFDADAAQAEYEAKGKFSRGYGGDNGVEDHSGRIPADSSTARR